MKRKIISGVILTILLVAGLSWALPYTDYKQEAGDRRWHTKLNAFIDAVSADVGSLFTSVNNWTQTEDYLIFIPAVPTYSDGTTFTVPGDYSTKFAGGRIVLLDMGTDGLKTNTVSSSSFSGGVTTVILTTSNLTSNLSKVWVTATRDGTWTYSGGWFNASDYGTSQEALTAVLNVIGSQERMLSISVGTWSITEDTTIPTNVSLAVGRGAIFDIATGKTLTINGEILAGPYQIFSWAGTGAINLRNCQNQDINLKWFGSPDCTSISGDIQQYLLKAYQSLDVVGYGDGYKAHNIVLNSGLHRLATPFVYAPAAGWTTTYHWLPNLVGKEGAVLYMDVGSGEDGITIGGGDNGQRWINGSWIKNLTILGDASGCRHALYLACWNSRGGTENINIQCGSTSSVVFITSAENSTWDFRYGPGSNRYTTGFNTCYAGTEVTPVTGVGYEIGGGTFNTFKIHKTFCSGMVYALKLDTVGSNTVVEEGDIEACSGAEVQSNYGGGGSIIPMYNGGITRIGQTVTLSDSTQIDNICFALNQVGSPTGKVTAKIYSTAVGAPDAALYTCWQTLNASDLNGGNAFNYLFKTAQQTYGAGTYFVDVEYTGGDASNYVGVQVTTAGTPGTCYTYSGAAWHAQTYTMAHAVNARGAIWIKNSGNVTVKSHHMEANWQDYLIDKCTDIEIISPQAGLMDVQRSTNVLLSGNGGLFSITSDPFTSLTLGNNRSTGATHTLEFNFGSPIYNGYQTTWARGVPTDVKGNSTANLFPNTFLERWQATMPDGLTKSADMTWTKCGDGLVDTTRHPLTKYCALLTASKTTQDNWSWGSLSGALLEVCRNRWVNWSIYMMLPSGQTFTSVQYLAPGVTVPAWAPSTQYNVGDGANGGAAICVESGISGSGAEPTWGSAALLEYTVDGTVVWLNCYPWSAQGFGDSFSDDSWRRLIHIQFIHKNATAAAPTWQWYNQITSAVSTAYFALPMLNFGRMPGMAPDSRGVFNGVTYINGLAIMADTVIPSDITSRYVGNYHNKGDTCYQIGGSGTSKCTDAGTPGTWSAF